MDSETHTPRTRRLLATVGAVGLFAAAGAPNALAQVGLTETAASLPSAPATDQPVTETVAQATQPVPQAVPAQTPPAPDATETATPVVQTGQEAAKEPVQTATQPANSTVDTAQKGATDPTGTVNQTVGPVADTSQKTVETVTQTAAPVVTRVAETSASATDALAPVVEDTPTVAAPLANDALGSASTTTDLPDSTGTPRGGTQSEAAASPSESFATGVTPITVTAPRAPEAPQPTSRDFLTPRAPRPGVSITSSAPVGDLYVTPHGGVAMPSSHTHAPVPDNPSGPLTALLSASASVGGGALVILLAALAAALSLAAPGLGRRLRPRLAPWPQPILHLSLERPG
jgi:hypothetical protein